MGIKTVDIYDLILVRETTQAVLVRRVEAQAEDVDWVPKSQISNIQYGKDIPDEATGRTVREIHSMTIPEWLKKTKEYL